VPALLPPDSALSERIHDWSGASFFGFLLGRHSAAKSTVFFAPPAANVGLRVQRHIWGQGEHRTFPPPPPV
jgi:hypothetical protein